MLLSILLYLVSSLNHSMFWLCHEVNFKNYMICYPITLELNMVANEKGMVHTKFAAQLITGSELTFFKRFAKKIFKFLKWRRKKTRVAPTGHKQD